MRSGLEAAALALRNCACCAPRLPACTDGCCARFLCSAGIPDLLQLMVKLTQSLMVERLMFVDHLQASQSIA